MKQLDRINDQAYQRFFLTGNPGQRITMTLRFLASQSLWVMDLSLNTVSVNGLQVINSPNLLRQFRNTLPFGISCQTKDGYDPYYVNDFSTKRAALFLLTQAEVEQIEAGLFT